MACLIVGACGDKNLPDVSSEVASKGVNGGALSDDGKYAVVGSLFHGGSLWRTEDHERLYNWNHNSGNNDKIILSADIDPSNTRALTADAATLVLWDINSGEALRFWSTPAEVLSSRLFNNGRYAILGLADHSAVIFDAVNGGITRTFTHKGRVRSVDISNDQRLAITGSEDQSATVWDIESGEALFTMNHDEDIQLVSLSNVGRYALTASQYDRVELWDLITKSSLGMLPLKKEQLKRGLRITAAEFSHNNRHLLLSYPNQKIELREVKTLDLIKEWTLPKRKQWQPTASNVIDLAFDPAEDRYWVLSSDGFIHQLR